MDPRQKPPLPTKKKKTTTIGDPHTPGFHSGGKALIFHIPLQIIDTYIIILSLIYKLKHKETIKMDISSYFRSASKSSVVSSSSDSEDGYESEIDVQPNPPKKHCSSSTSKLASKSGSGLRRYNKKFDMN